MFGWFKRAPKREIFHFHDGQRDRCADPIQILRKLNARPNFEEDIQLADRDDEFGREAYAGCMQAIREAFGILPLTESGEGLTENESWDVFNKFTDFLATIKKKQPT